MKRKKQWAGQSMVETALVLPFFLLLLLGIFEFSRAFYIWQSLYRAAQVGAREGSMAPSPAEAAVVASAATKATLQTNQFGYNDPTVCVPTVNGCGGSLSNSPIRVTVSAPFQSAAGKLIPSLSNLTLTARGSSFYMGLPPKTSWLPSKPVSGPPPPPPPPGPPPPPPGPPPPAPPPTTPEA